MPPGPRPKRPRLHGCAVRIWIGGGEEAVLRHRGRVGAVVPQHRILVALGKPAGGPLGHAQVVDDEPLQAVFALAVGPLADVRVGAEGPLQGQRLGEQAGVVAAVGHGALARRVAVQEAPGRGAGQAAELVDEEAHDDGEDLAHGAAAAAARVGELDGAVERRDDHQAAVLVEVDRHEEDLQLPELRRADPRRPQHLAAPDLAPVRLEGLVECLRLREHGSHAARGRVGPDESPALVHVVADLLDVDVHHAGVAHGVDLAGVQPRIYVLVSQCSTSLRADTDGLGIGCVRCARHVRHF